MAALSSQSMSISVVLVCTTHAATLRRALDSISNQSFNNYELICICAGTDATTREMARRAEERNVRMSVYDLDEPSRLAAIRLGAHKAKGTYLFFLDDSMWLEPTCLEDFLSHTLRAHDASDAPTNNLDTTSLSVAGIAYSQDRLDLNVWPRVKCAGSGAEFARCAQGILLESGLACTPYGKLFVRETFVAALLEVVADAKPEGAAAELALMHETCARYLAQAGALALIERVLIRSFEDPHEPVANLDSLHHEYYELLKLFPEHTSIIEQRFIDLAIALLRDAHLSAGEKRALIAELTHDDIMRSSHGTENASGIDTFNKLMQDAARAGKTNQLYLLERIGDVFNMARVDAHTLELFI